MREPPSESEYRLLNSAIWGCSKNLKRKIFKKKGAIIGGDGSPWVTVIGDIKVQEDDGTKYGFARRADRIDFFAVGNEVGRNEQDVRRAISKLNIVSEWR